MVTAMDSGLELPLADRLEAVQQGVADAAALAGRDVAGITTIVVTKFQPVSLIRDLIDLGVRDFGENRHQEAEPKAVELVGERLTWHFVGQLQSKKARQVARYSDVIHSVDRASLVRALSTVPGRTDCFIQLNLTGNPERGGIGDDGLEALVEEVASTGSLRLLGVMAVAPLDIEPRTAFARVHAASERVQELVPEASAISAGMSHDYVEAILEGATHLRIGTAITGNRPIAG